jgi:hypothetical protein
MKIGRYIKLTGDYEGLVADIGGKIEIEEKGTLLIVLDLTQKNNHPDINVVPCKVIHLIDKDDHDIWLAELNNFVYKKHKFS